MILKSSYKKFSLFNHDFLRVQVWVLCLLDGVDNWLFVELNAFVFKHGYFIVHDLETDIQLVYYFIYKKLK
jgi:hypothetical protein